VPITQERVIRIVSEGLSLREALRALKQDVHEALLAGDLELVRLVIDNSPEPSTLALELESRHFQKERKRNERNAKRMAEARRAR